MHSLVQATTGTGKTTAFLLPAIQNAIIDPPPNGQLAVLIISPTRELAAQTAAEATRLVSRLRTPLPVHTAYGGTGKASNLARFRSGNPKILVATPGRLIDYLSEVDVRDRFLGMKTLVLDEADKMLDAGFLPDILKILKTLPSKRDGQWQGMCFSATLPPTIQKVLSNVLKENYISISTYVHSLSSQCLRHLTLNCDTCLRSKRLSFTLTVFFNLSKVLLYEQLLTPKTLLALINLEPQHQRRSRSTQS